MNHLKTKKCINCSTNYHPYTTTQKCCCVTCAISYNRKKVEVAHRKEIKKDLLTISDYKKIARQVFQKFIRLRDTNEPCISCGTITATIWDAGHYFKAELFSGLIFDENNCHKQCRKCNTFLNGNEIQYRMGLVKRFGEKWVKALEKKSEKMRVRKWSKFELEELKNTYQEKILVFKK